MNNLINISDLLKIRNLENKVSRLQNEIELHLKNISNIRTENFGLFAQASRLKEENDELRELLKTCKVYIVNG